MSSIDKFKKAWEIIPLQKELDKEDISKELCDELWNFCDSKGYNRLYHKVSTINIIQAIYEMKTMFLTEVCYTKKFKNIMFKTLFNLIHTDYVRFMIGEY